MNDDQIDALLADLGTDVPEMSDKAFEAGRTRLQAKVSPEPVVTVLERDVAVVPLPKRRLLRSPPRKLIMPVAAAAAAMALAAGVLVTQAARLDSAAPAESASVQLNAIADKVKPVAEVLRPGQYRYSAVRTWGMHGGSTDKSSNARPDTDLEVMVEIVQEKWAPVDPTLPCKYRFTTTGNRRWVLGTAEQGHVAGLDLPEPEVREMTAPCDENGHKSWASPSDAFLASLPRDPGQLNDRLRNDAERTNVQFTPDLTLADDVVNLLMSGIMPNDLRAALYRTLAMTPGLEITENVDLDGHKGTAFGVSGVGQRHDVIIDPTTGEFIGLRRIHLSSPKPAMSEVAPGTVQPNRLYEDKVVAYATMTNAVIVDRVGETS